MTTTRHIIFLIAAVLMAGLSLYSCKEKYLPQIKESNVNYLVVEGLINTGADSTIFELSRTFKLDNKSSVAAEKGALVQVENETGNIYILPETIKSGRYGRPALGLDPTKRYRLRILTKDKKEYLSEFVESKISQPIDDLKFDFNNDQLNIYAFSDDPTGNSRYYRYTYVETVEYTSSLVSILKVENKKIENRLPPDMIWRCYKATPSNDIVLASTTGLTRDAVADKHITSVPRGSLKIRLGYSIQVKQQVLTREGFEFYESLKKNTESVGTVFDPQPSQLFGNIRSTTNPSDIVIGFISAGTITDKRITVISTDLPLDWFLPREIDSLCLRKIEVSTEPSIVAQHPVYVPIEPLTGQPGFYRVTKDLECVDCRRQGGTTIKPPYWP